MAANCRYLAADVSAIPVSISKPTALASSPATATELYATPLQSALIFAIDSFGLESIRCTACTLDATDGEGAAAARSTLAHMAGAYACGVSDTQYCI